VAVPSGTVTFLFTDIEGSTRLWQQDESAMRAALSRHDELLHQVIADEGGTVFSTMGDGVAAAFPSASSAVRAALGRSGFSGPRRGRRRYRSGCGSACTPVRPSCATGAIFDTTVNRAARLMAVAHGGQVVCSQATAALVDSEAAMVDLGDHSLRDLDRPMRGFQVGGGSFRELRSLDAFPGNLPLQVTSFVGRDDEVGRSVTRSPSRVW
jgi:class 3 adenylate cyclase